jgi:hypothetical protein
MPLTGEVKLKGYGHSRLRLAFRPTRDHFGEKAFFITINNKSDDSNTLQLRVVVSIPKVGLSIFSSCLFSLSSHFSCSLLSGQITRVYDL